VTGPQAGPTEADLEHLRAAIDLAEQCPPSATAFSVGAIVVAADGTVLATGYSREGGDPHVHAEESALNTLAAGGLGDPRLTGATIYTSLEPCSTRASRPVACTQLILDTGVPRIVFAWREPALFVDCIGAELLRAAGRETIEVPALAVPVRRTNAHLPGVSP
jgi:pyrimidine deaminase RibD-like protein